MNRARRREAGYTYLLLLFAVAAAGLVAAGAAEMWSTLAQREKEQELLFIGNQYREALRRYREAIPDAPQRLPATLDELLRDPRFPGVRRHLRRIYADPMTGRVDWVLLREGGGIAGIHSRATGRPLKQGGFAKRDEGLAGAASYADWLFVSGSEAETSPPPATAAPQGSPTGPAGRGAPVTR